MASEALLDLFTHSLMPPDRRLLNLERTIVPLPLTAAASGRRLGRRIRRAAVRRKKTIPPYPPPMLVRGDAQETILSLRRSLPLPHPPRQHGEEVDAARHLEIVARTTRPSLRRHGVALKRLKKGTIRTRTMDPPPKPPCSPPPPSENESILQEEEVATTVEEGGVELC